MFCYPAGDRDNLKEHAMCNFEYLLASVHSTNASNLLYEFETTFSQVLDAELVLLHRCIVLGSSILAHDPLQLASELIGRLRIVKGEWRTLVY